MKILLTVPTFENIEPDTFKSIYGLDKCNHDVLFDFTKGYDCARARNMIAQESLDGGYDYVLMVDSDIILPSNALMYLTDPLADICLGAYPRKNTLVGETELFRLGEYNYTNACNISMTDLISSKTPRIEVHGGGMGCAFIKTEVFRILPYPWFQFVTYKDGGVLSEDLYFCDTAISNGLRVFADTRVRCGHVAKSINYW